MAASASILQGIPKVLNAKTAGPGGSICWEALKGLGHILQVQQRCHRKIIQRQNCRRSGPLAIQSALHLLQCEGGGSTVMLAATLWRRTQHSLGEHQKVHPCPLIVVVCSRGAGPSEGLTPTLRIRY